MSFFAELKRRNVFKVAVAYGIASWLILQIVDLVLENINAPDWVMQVFMLGIAVGFPIAIIIAWAFEVTPEGVKLEKNVDRSQSIARQTGQQLNRGIIMILSVAVVFLLTDRFREEASQVPERATAPAQNGSIEQSEAHAVEAERSIAVLPFVNMSSDPEQDYFADGISEEILNALAKVSDLKVAGRTSSFAFKGKNEDLLEIGKVLRVNHILEGSVRKSGNRLRITAQLIKVDDGFHMWSETYDRELTDIFAIQDEISAAILTQLKAQLLGDQQIASTQTNTRTYELYLLAKQRIYDRNQASLEMATKLLREAITIDPVYAPAFAQMGIAMLLLSEDNYGTLLNSEAGSQGKQFLDEALRLDPNNAEALAGIGLYHRNNTHDRQTALESLQQALSINPNLVNANLWLSTELTISGRIQDGHELLEQNFDRDPLHIPTVGNLQQSYMLMGQKEKALEMLEGLQTYLPENADLAGDYGEVALLSGQLAESMKHFQYAYKNDPLNTVNRFWYGWSLFGALRYDLMAEIAPDQTATLALSRLGKKEEAFILGNKAIGTGVNPTFYFQVLIENDRHAELINVLETRWSSLDEFTREWPGKRGYGSSAMCFIAEAYRKVGNTTKFNEAMGIVRSALESQVAEGADNWPLTFSRARYAILSNDFETAVSFMEKAFQQGGYLDTGNETAWPIFKTLDGHPRYEAAKAAMNARLESELNKMTEHNL